MADRAFGQLGLLALAVVLPLGTALTLTLFPADLQRALHGSHSFVDACLAALYGLGRRLPPLGAPTVALAAAALAAGSLRALTLLGRTRALISGCAALPRPGRLLRTAGRLGIADRVVLFDAPIAAAFTAGFLRPRIFLSLRALAALDDDELEAVLLHERVHLASADPRRVALVRCLASALFFVPLADTLRRRFEVAKELDADRAVVAAQRGVRHLASSLQRLGGSSERACQEAAVGAWSSATARIAQLEGAEVATLLPPASRRATVLTALALAGLVGLVLGQSIRGDIVPEFVWIAGGASAVVHACPVPVQGPLL